MPIRDKVYDKLKSMGLTDSKEDFFSYYDSDENVRKQVYKDLKADGLTDSEEEFYEYMKPQTQPEEDDLFEENQRLFAEGKPTKKVTTQSMIDAHPELGLQPEPQLSKTDQYILDNKPEIFGGKKPALVDIPLGDTEELSNERLGKRLEIAQSNQKERTKSRLQSISDEISTAMGDLQERVEVSEIDKLRPANMQYMPTNPVNKELMPEYTALRKARRLVEESENIIEEASKKGNTNFVAGLARGFWDNLNAEDYTFGADDAEQSAYLLRALDKAEKGEELTKAEETLLDAAAINMATQAFYAQDLGKGYKAGSVTAESIPFMMEMAINPISSFGKASAKQLLNYGLKRFVGNAVKGLAKGAAAGAGMAATTGIGRVAEGTTDRLAENYNYGVGLDGQLYVEKERDMGIGEAAVRSFASTAIENQSEMIFNAFRGAGQLMKGLDKYIPGGVNTFFDAVKNSKVGQIWKGIKNSPLRKDFMEATNIGGIGEEYLEEVYNNLANFAIGEMEWKDVVSLDNNIDTFLGLAPTQAMFMMLGLGNMGAIRYQTKRDIENLRASMNEQQQRQLDELLSMGKVASNLEVRDLIHNTVVNQSLTSEQKRASIEAAYNIAMSNAAEQIAEAETQDRVETENAAIDAMTDPSTGKYAELTRKMPEGVGGTVEQQGYIVGWIGNAPVFVPEGMENTVENRVVLQPSEWDSEAVQEMDNAEVKALNEEMIREEAANQAEMESKYAPEVLNAQMVQGQPIDTPSKQIIPISPMPEGNGWIVEVYAKDTNNKVAAKPEVKEMTTEEFRDMLQAQYEAEQAAAEQLQEQVEEAVEEAPVAEQDVKPIGKGIFGYIYDQFKGKIKEGVNFLLKKRSGSLKGVLYRKELGDIDIVWGNNKAGLAHIITKHVINQDDFSSVDNAVSVIEDTVNNGDISIQKDGRIAFSKDGYRVAVERNEENNWVVTALDTSRKQKEKKRSEQDATRLHQSIFGEENGELVSPQTASLSTNKDTEKNVQSQENQEDFISMGKERSYQELGKVYGEKMPHKVEVTAKALAEDMAKAQAALDKAQEAVDNAPIGREAKAKAALDKAQQEFDAVKREADFWNEMDADIKAAQAEREAILNQKIEAMGEEPMTADEFVAQQLSNGNIALTVDSYKKETGYGEAERKKFPKMFRKAENGGMTIERAGERLMEIASEEGLAFFDQNDPNAGRDALLNVLGSVQSWGDVTGYIRSNRERQAEREYEGLRNEMEDAAIEAHYDSLEDYVLQREWAEVDIPFEGVDINEKMAIFAETAAEYENYLNQQENGQGTTEENAEGTDDVLSEEQSDNTGRAEEQQEPERTDEGIADESEAAHAGEQEIGQRQDETILEYAERIDKEEQRRRPIRERANEWGAKLGVKVNIIENINDVTNEEARKAILNGERVTGWYEESTGEVCLYIPYITSEKEIDATYIHEVVAHKGVRGLLGDKFGEFCDDVWDMMSNADRAKFMSYPGVSHLEGKEKARAAADEYIAHLAENIDVSGSVWNKFTELLRKFLKAIGIEPKMSDAEIANTIKLSYQRLIEGGAENVGGEGTRFNAKRISDRRQEMNRVNNTVDQALSLVYGKDIKEIRKERQEQEQKRKEDAEEIYQSVLSGDFNDVTLQKINDYIDDATPLHPYGKRISQRLPQKLERDLHEGSRTNAVDALFSRIHEKAVPASRRASEAGRREIEERKKESLKGWAIATNNWHTDLSEFTDEHIPIGEGTDSKVYASKDGKYVIKTSFGKPEGKRFRPDIDNIPLFNHVFRNSAYEIVGYGEFDGKFARILKQPFVEFAEDSKVSVDERVDYMHTLGFEPINEAKTAFSNGMIIVADLQKSNIVKDVQGNVRVIDADVKLHTKDVGGNYTYPPVEADLPENTRFRTVYHGSAADFDKFDRNFSGSGEGQAVMGAGHYVTASEGTGRYYAEVASDKKRKVVQEGGYTYNGKVVRSRPLVDAYEALKKNEFDVDKAIESIEHRIAVIRRVKGDKANTTNAEEAIRLLNEEKANKGTLGYQEEILEKPDRHLYEVEIPDDNGKNYFDLDKKATKKTKDEAKKRLYSALDNSEEAEYWKKNRDIVENEWKYNVNTSEATNDSVRATMEQFLTQEEVADILSDMGYVGSKSKATDGTTYIIYKDDSLEIKSNTRFRVSNRNQEIFVSNVQKAVEGIKQEKGTPQQWLAMIEKNSGLKAGEDKWLGLSDWLKASDKKSLSKAEILDFIGENKIRIEEVHYASRRVFNDEGKVESDAPINSTRLNYTTKGLENKQEIALTVPTIEPWNEVDEVHFGDAGQGRAIAWIRFGETTGTVKESSVVDDYLSEMRSKYNAAEGEEVDYMSEDEVKHLQSLTFSEFNAKENAPRILVIDEIQSKRHQEGRDKGYKSQADRTPAKMEDLIFGEFNGLTTATYKGERLFFSKGKSKEEILEMINERISSGQLGSMNNLIPDAPFEKNWSELAMKRMLRYAAENGYDKVAWTTGAQQAKRYKLSNVIDSISISKSRNEEGKYYVTSWDKETMPISAASGSKTSEELKELFGKGIAQSLIEGVDNLEEGSDTFTLEGADLEVGGEGMKGFYDKMLPSFVNKYVKKWGTKVQDIELPNVEEAGRIMHSVDVTEAMKESVMEGQTMFRVKMDDTKKTVDAFTSKYNSKPVVVIDSNMTDEELEEIIPGELADNIRKGIATGINGGYDYIGDKIYIFADNVSPEDIEDALFHENHHAQFLNDKHIINEFYGNSIDKFPKNKSQIRKEGYSEELLPEELFVRILADAETKGDFHRLEKYLSKETYNELINLLKENGYDIEKEIDARRGRGRSRIASTRSENGEIPLQSVAEESERSQSRESGRVRSEISGQGERAREIRQLFDQVADNGLRGVVGDDFYDRSMLDMYRSLPMEAREKVAMDALSNHDADMGKAIDKFVSESYGTSSWDIIVGAIRNMLRKKGFDIRFSDNDIRYLVWRNRQKLNRSSIIDVAEDIDTRFRIYGGNSGYVGYSMSKRAAEAREDGRYPKTDFKKEYGVTENSFNILVEAGIIDDSEWHHTSKFGNKTTFYSWNEERYFDIYTSRKKEIDKKSREIQSLKPKMADFELSQEGMDAFTDKDREYWEAKKSYANQLWNEFNEEDGGDTPDGGGTRFRVSKEEQAIIDDAKSNGTYMKAPNGKPTNLTERQWVQVRTKAFKKWFGDWENNPSESSKVVDENGEPLVVYHTSHEEWSEFDKERGYIWSWRDQERAGSSSEFGVIEYSLFMNLRNPFVFDAEYQDESDIDFSDWDGSEHDSAAGIVSWAVEQNSYDGVVIKNVKEFADRIEGNDYVAFKPNQIKSATDNVGTFDEGNNDIRFRVSGKLNIRDEYEALTKKGKFQAREALQDAMLSLRRVQEMIEKATGKKLRDFENAWMHENRLSSVVQAEIHEMERKFYKPMMNAVSKLAKAMGESESYAVADYLILKHGIERNREMAVRKALTDSEGKIDRAKLDQWYQDKEAIRNDASLDTWEKKQEEMDSLAFMYGADMSVDYSGLTSVFDTDDVGDALVKAFFKVGFMEQEYPAETKALGDAVKAMTQSCLDKAFESGLMDRKVYDELSKDMYDYYIPLRGFEETTSDEVYAYMDNDRGAFNAPLVRAKGRTSKSDNPLAYMKSIAESGIMQGNRNKMKQTFLNMVINNPSDLVSVKEGVWAMFNPTTGEWEAVSAPPIPNNATPADIENIMENWEAQMERNAQSDPNVKKVREADDIPYRVVGNRINQHQVIVKRLGKSYTLTINGNPRLAMALNGQTNPNNTSNDGKVAAYVSGKIDAVNRNLAAWYTTRNPDFVASNFMRDTFYTNTIVRAKEGNTYANKFHKQYARLLMPNTMLGLFNKYENGTLDPSKPIERDFLEFMMNGGETGYSNLKDLEQIKKQIEKEVKGSRWQKVETMLERLDILNRAVENTARFAAYRTSRQMGRSIAKSVFDAKEISVNFNKKGSGGTFSGMTGQTKMGNLAAMLGAGGRAMYVFFNAAIQGTTNLLHAAKVNPVGTSAGLTAMFIMGAIVPYLLGGDDENDYYDLPEHVRRNHLILPGAGDAWISIPLPIEYRIMYGMGELLTSWRTGHERGENIARKMLSLSGQALPLNFLEEGLDAFVPSAISPLWQSYNNRSWTGLPIYKENEFNKHDPEYTKAYSNTDRNLVKFTKALYDWTFDEENQKEGVDLNPAIIETIARGYFGGMFTTWNNLAKTLSTIQGEREFDWRNIPIANRVFKSGDVRTKEKRITNEYFENIEKYEFMQARERRLNKVINGEAVPDDDKREADEEYKIMKGSTVYDKYISGSESFKAKKKEIDKVYRKRKEKDSEELERKYYKLLDEANKIVL